MSLNPTCVGHNQFFWFINKQEENKLTQQNQPSSSPTKVHSQMQFLRRGRSRSHRASTNDAEANQQRNQPPNDGIRTRRASINTPSATTPRSPLNTGALPTGPTGSLGSLGPPGLLRTLSEETLTTNILHDSGNYVSGPLDESMIRALDSTMSSAASIADTVVDLVLGHSFTEFSEVRLVPVTSILFQKGIFIFPSEASLTLFKSHSRNVPLELRKEGLGMPLLQCVSPMLSTFKRSSPIMVFYKYKPPRCEGPLTTKNEHGIENPKVEYCRVFFKHFRDGTAKYYLRFFPNGNVTTDDPDNFEVILMSSSKIPCFDTKYRNTRMRWLGTTMAYSTYGSGFFKLQILSEESPSLLDGLDLSDPDCQPSTSRIPLVTSDILAQLSSFPPVARFSDHDSTTIPKKLMTRLGDVKLIEVASDRDRNSIKSVPECSLVLTVMSIVIRDQEVKKSYGSSRSSDSASSANVFY